MLFRSHHGASWPGLPAKATRYPRGHDYPLRNLGHTNLVSEPPPPTTVSGSEAGEEVSMAQLLQAIQTLTTRIEGTHVRLDGMQQQMGDVNNRLAAMENRPAVELPALLPQPPTAPTTSEGQASSAPHLPASLAAAHYPPPSSFLLPPPQHTSTCPRHPLPPPHITTPTRRSRP